MDGSGVFEISQPIAAGLLPTDGFNERFRFQVRAKLDHDGKTLLDLLIAVGQVYGAQMTVETSKRANMQDRRMT